MNPSRISLRPDRLHYRRAFALLLVSALLLGLATPGEAARLARGEKAMAATAHPAASKAAAEVLADGGTAADAFVAAALVLGVVEPYSSGLGGGGFALYRDETGKIHAYDFRERAPLSATRDLFVRDGAVHPELSRVGGLAVGVPGQPKGLDVIHRRHGKLERRRLAQPALRLAAEGIQVEPHLHERIESVKETLVRFEGSRELWLRDGKAPAVGSKIRQTGMARALTLFAKEGADPFYTGKIGRAIAEIVQKHGGILSPRDLAEYRVHEVEPVRGRFGEWEVVSFPPPSSGGIILVEMLSMVRAMPAGALVPGAARVHALTEVMKRAYADRAEYLGDVRFVDVPRERLISPAYGAQRLADFDANKATDVSAGTVSVIEEGEHTTHLSIVGPRGDAISATLTINLRFGSGLTVPGWGIVLNNEMDDFTAAPGIPNAFGLIQGERNAVAGGKTPLSSMTPTMAFIDGKVRYVLGTPGGSRIISTVFHLFVNVAAFGMSPADAMDAPRFHHQWRPDKLFHEKPLPAELAQELTKMGHEVIEVNPYCNAQSVWIEEDGGLLGISDERGVGEPAGF